jgi:hypothetical protein
MSNRILRMTELAAIALPILAGCASNSAKVLERGASDLACDAANVSVTLTERPYLGVTRYEASGCGETRSYECRARAYVVGLPLGERTCKRTGSPAGPVVSPEAVVF